MQQLSLITPFAGWLQPIHVHIRLQQRSADFTWLLKNKIKLLSRNRISCDITKRQKYEVPPKLELIILSNYHFKKSSCSSTRGAFWRQLLFNCSWWKYVFASIPR
jgi:hypothetical protein